MIPAIKVLWTDALRSDEYAQGTGHLHDPAENEFCCLGVLCDLAYKAGVVSARPVITDTGETATRFIGKSHQDGSTERLPKAVQVWAGLTGPDPTLTWTDEYGNEHADYITELNDTFGKTFDELAEMIEENF